MAVFDNPSQEFERYINGRQEKGDFYPSPGEARQQRGKEESKNLPLGTPRTDYTVRSVYDSRPVNAFDINPVTSAEIAAPGNTILTILTVPQNFICVPRAWHLFLTPLPAGTSPEDFEVSLRVDDAEIQFNVDIPVGVEMHDPFLRTFFVVDEFSDIQVDFRANIAVAGATEVHIRMYANLIQKTGIPAQFDIANLAGVKKPPPLVPTTVVAPSPRQTLPPPAPQSRAPVARPPTTCPPGYTLQRVQLSDGSFEDRCVKLLGQARRK